MYKQKNVGKIDFFVDFPYDLQSCQHCIMSADKVAIINCPFYKKNSCDTHRLSETYSGILVLHHWLFYITGHSAYVATDTESNGAKTDGF